MLPHEVRWTLDELCEQVEQALERDAPGAADGRVREVPDRRTIRYYTTLGLLDRPAEIRGRTAYYGPRHLLQLLAIKRLQAAGRSLAEIQQVLLGLGEAELRRFAGQPEERTERSRRTKGTREREEFWRTPPAPVAANEAAESTVLQAVRLGPGVVLTIDARRAVREDDLAALNQTAGQLVELLRARGLL